MKAKHIFIFVSLSVSLLFSFSGKAQEDTLQNKPNIKINVHVQRDANGNVVGYDSSYVETWSSDGQTNYNIDSILNSHFKTFNDMGLNHDMFFDFSKDSIFQNMFKDFGMINNDNFFNLFSMPDFYFPEDSVFGKMFSFPDFDKLREEMLDKMKQFNNNYKPPVEKQRDEQPVKKEKINFKPTNI